MRLPTIERFTPQPRVFAVVCVALWSALGPTGCAKRDAAPNPGARQAFARGDRVVVEQAAAQFFEGRVLAAESEHLRVQAVGGNDSLSVVASDVYRLPPAASELTPNLLAICGRGQDWLPCRLREVSGATLCAWSATGEAFDVARDRVLVPTSLTELNLKRYFARLEAEQAFAHGAQRAGEPRPEPGWRPAIHERLLVKQGGDWFTGKVTAIDEDGAQVLLNSGQRSVRAPLSALTAEPPSSFVNELRHGDFVLARPEMLSEPWARLEVRAVNDAELKLVDAAGVIRSASVREVVPLRP